MEIVGLLIIVILVTLIIFFSLMFTNRDKDENTIRDYQDDQIAKQLGNVMLETTINCENTNRRARELAINCASTNDIICAGEDACTKLNETFKEMINETLAKDLEYEVILTGFSGTPEDEKIKIASQGCITIKRGAKAYPPIIIGAGNLGSIRLTIRTCY